MKEDITIFICTDKDVRKAIVTQYMGTGLPYVNMISGKTYKEVVAKIEELETPTLKSD